MSKLYKSYINLKEQDSNYIYIFKSGMFYIFIDEDATKISEIFGFKLVKLNDKINKCGFPISRLDYYIDKMQTRGIKFKIIDEDYSKIENYTDYMNNNKLKEIVNKIIKINLDEISFRQAYEILEDVKLEMMEIYKWDKIMN